MVPLDRMGQLPELPATWTSNPAGLLAALADATETGIPDSARYALHCVQLQGGRNRIVATDGRQLLVRSGYRFPWAGDLLIKGSPIFACRTLPRDQAVEVGRTDSHAFFRCGTWTIACEIQKEVRFPDVEQVIPPASEVLTRLRLDPEDARFLESSLARLPGGDELNSPVTVDLNGKIAVRANAADQPQAGHRAGPRPVELHRRPGVHRHQSRAPGSGAAAGLRRDRLHRGRVPVRLPGCRARSSPSSR